MTRVAVLGTGIMGTGMAHSLQRAGHDVKVWNRSPEKAEAVGQGTAVATSVADAVSDVDVVITMFNDATATREVAESMLDALAGTDTLWVQSATVGIDDAAELAALAEKAGVAHIAAPVVGTKQPAEDGKLSIVAAGPTEYRDRVAPVFDAIGAKTTWVGEDRTRAAAMKIVVNAWLTALTGALAETLVLADGLGIEGSDFLELIDGGPTNAPYAQLKGKSMLARTYDPSFPLEHALKDLRLVERAAADIDLSVPLNVTLTQLYAKAVDEGHGQEDLAAVIEALRSQS